MSCASVMLLVTTSLAAKGPKPGDWSFGWIGVASIAEVALAIIVCSWVIIAYLSAHKQREGDSPWRLFADLCSAHKLSRRQRRILKRLALEQQLEQPATLFIEPSCYSKEKLGPDWVCHADEFDRLRQRLFATH